MRSPIALSLILLLAPTSPRASASELIFSRDYTPNGGASPMIAPIGIQFVIDFQSPNAPSTFQKFGRQAYWLDGSVGAYDFSEDNSPEFADFVELVTNGVDDEISLMTWNDLYGGSGGTAPESGWGFGDPDLAGSRIDFIRLMVHDLSLQSYIDPDYGFEGLLWNGHITWEFWGEPIPEPTTACLMLTLGICLTARRPLRRRRDLTR